MPRVSVVVPAYNAAMTLGETLRSVAAQSYADVETIVVDDGSTDGTPDIPELNAPSVRFVRQENSGVSSARNAALDRAGGEIIAFLDADDVWRPSKLQQHVDLLDRAVEVGLTYASVVRIDERARVTGQIEARDHDDPVREMLLRGTIVPGPSSAVVRRSALGDLRFDERLSQVADWHLWLRLGVRTRMRAIRQPLSYYRTHRGNMSSDVTLLERDTFRALDAFFDEDPESRRYARLRRHSYGNHWMIAAGSYLQAGERRDAVRCVARGTIVWPPSIIRPLTLPLRRAGRRWHLTKPEARADVR